jgi:AraC-like DNA-binding protein
MMRSIVGAFSTDWQRHNFGSPAPVTHQTLFYLDKGDITIFIDDMQQERHATRGDLIWLPKGTLRTWYTTTGVYMYVIRSIADLPVGYPLLQQPGIHNACNPCHAQYLCQCIVDRYIRDDYREYLENTGLFNELLGLYLKSGYLATFALSKVSTVSDVLSYMAAHFSDPELTLEQLIELSSWSRGYFMKVFREYTGETPMGYLRRLRINAAVELLNSGDRTVTEVAYRVGFNDPAYFSRAFTRYVGRPPSELTGKV